MTYDIMDVFLAWAFGMLFAVMLCLFIAVALPWLMGWRSISYNIRWPNAKAFERIEEESIKYGGKARI